MSSLRIVAISDTHGLHNQISLPDGDILIHAGDFTNRGKVGEIGNFLSWFAKQPHQYKCFISGNHELGLERGSTREERISLIKGYMENHKNFFYLENSSVSINKIKIYGSPNTPFYFDWEWNVPRGPEIAKIWSRIPDDTHVLITHGPPYGKLDLVEEDFSDRDRHQGCQDLMNRIDNLPELRVHIYGHLHLQGGNQINLKDKIFANAAMCDDSKIKLTREPLIIDI